MKLINKKSGEIGYTAVLQSKAIVIMDENAIQLGSYNSLAELNGEWEDYVEPKEYWYIEPNGVIERIDEWDCCTENDREVMRLIGNHFETREEAKKAVEKLKAWKRLKDKGFRFEYYDYSDRDLHNHIQIKAITNREVEDSMLYKEDLDLLFGGEE